MTTEPADTPPVTSPDVFVGRQAIFDASLEVVGYELLFRRKLDDLTADFRDRDEASTSVILDSFLDLGLERIVGDVPAFLNLTRSFFLSPRKLPLPKGRVVLELLEGEEVDPPLIESVRAYAEAGYRIALDDFVLTDSMRPLLEIADIVKLDVLELEPSELQRYLEVLAPYDLVFLAEKVETLQQFEECKRMGFDLFQGYFLCRPNVVHGHRVPPNRLSTLKLLAKLQDPDVSMDSLEQVIREDVSLSYKLLRLINSAFYGLPQKIESIRQTLVLLGVHQIRSWVSLMAMSRLADKPDELMLTAMVRGRMCEELAERAGCINADAYFTAGLFSTLDALLDLPMQEVLESLPLSEDLVVALLRREGPMGAALACVLAYEFGDFEAVTFRDLRTEQIRDAFFDAVAWAEHVRHELGF